MTVFEAIANAKKKGLAIEIRSAKNGFERVVLSGDWSKGALFITAYSYGIEYHTVLNKIQNGKIIPLSTSRIKVKK